MTLPEEARHRLSKWCSARVPAPDRAHRQIGYTIQGDQVTILERRPPVYPELNTAWSSVPLVLLRLEDPRSGRWVLYQRRSDDAGWERASEGGNDPIALLEQLVA